jgi:tryptophan synthase alpha chain
MSNRIDDTFARLQAEGKKAFVAYVTAGDPNPDRSLEIIRALADAGSDIIELGMPFSDPLADGIVNQMAADRALKAGSNTPKVLDLIRRFRETHQTPIVLYAYLNPIITYGWDEFHTDAAAAGVDGILPLDLPPDEADLHPEMVSTHGLHSIHLIAPTTPPDRVKLLSERATGFIYALSRTGVTGAHGAPSDTIGETVARIKEHASAPVCVGFGINTPEQAAQVAAHCDGIIVGSAIVRQIEANAEDPDVAAKVAAFVTPLIAAIR